MKAEVCLVSPASRANEPYPPLGLMYVAGYLDKQGIEVAIIDVKVDPYRGLIESRRRTVEERILEEVEAIAATLIGITCLVTEVGEVINLSRRIKSKLRKARIMVGGIHPTMYPEDLLFPGSPVDYVVISEGEQTAAELVQAIVGGDRIEDVRSIAWFDGTKVYRTPPRSVIENLDEIPFPLYKRVDTAYYFRPNIYAIRNMLLSAAFVFTSRGCPYQCSFCVNKNIQSIMGSQRLIRSRSVTNVVDEIEFLAEEYGIDGFYIYDDTFCVHKQYTLDFCQALLRRKLKLIWAAETRVNLVSEEMIRAMRDAGCVQLDFGVESGSPEILKRLRKGITVDQVTETFVLCHRLGMRTLANFMFNTTGETEDDVQKTLALAREIKADYYNFSLMTPFPGTDIYDQVEPKLKVDEYPLLGEGIRRLTDPRFKFAQHNLDQQRIIWKAHRSFNTLAKRISFLIVPGYLRQVVRSKRRGGYLRAIWDLLRLMVRYYLEKPTSRMERASKPEKSGIPSSSE